MRLKTQLLSLLFVLHQTESYQFEFIVNVTQKLNVVHHFQNFIIFRNESAMSNVRGRSLEETLQKEFNVPLICCNGDVATTLRLRKLINIRSLGFVILNSLADHILNVTDKTLTNLHYMRLIFILTKSRYSLSRRALGRFFWWCWNANFLNVIVTFKSRDGTGHEVFTFNPFPDHINMINLTNTSEDRYFWNKVTNVKGYKFATPVFIDEPLVMMVHNERTNKTRITGTAGRLYSEFLNHINATFFLINISSTSLHLHQKHVVQLTTDKVIDVSIHPYSYLLPYETDGSYPIAHTNACIILPVVPEINRSCYVIYAFNHKMWMIIFGLFTAFLAMELTANYTWEQRFVLGHSIESTIGGMINQPRALSLPPPGSAGRWKTKALMSSLLLFTGFFVSNLYVAALTSLFSTTVYGTQPESIEEILATRLEILLLDYEETAFFNTSLFPKSLRKRVRITDPDTLAHYRNRLNTTYAYIVKEERWKMIDYQQSRLWKPVFKIARDFCIPNMFLSFPIQVDSPFYEVLKSFTLSVDSAGLYAQWSEMSYHEAKEAGLIVLLKETRKHPVPLSMEHFQLVFSFIGVSYVMCVGCLLAETYVYALRNRV